MIRYTSIKSALRFIPKPLFDSSSDLDFLSWMLDGFRQLDLPVTMESKIKIFEIKSGKVILPQDIREIKLITYLATDPSKSDLESFSSCICNPESNATTEDTNNPCQYTIAYKQFLDSPYYHNNYMPLQYKGNSGDSILCKNCPNRYAACQNIFTVDKNNVLNTNLNTGFLCIDYLTEIMDEDCDFLIPDFTEIKQYLAYYAIAKHWEDRAAAKEQNASNIAQDALIKAEIYLRKSRGMLILRDVNANDVAAAQYDGYQHLIKIPEKYVYSR